MNCIWKKVQEAGAGAVLNTQTVSRRSGAAVLPAKVEFGAKELLENWQN